MPNKCTSRLRGCAASGTLIAAAAVVGGCLPAPVRAAPVEPLPFPAQLSTVIDRGSIEGHAVRVLRFASREALAKVLSDTRRAWSLPHGGGTVESVSGPWRIVSRQSEGGFQTLQARSAATGGTEGLVTSWFREASLPRTDVDLVGVLPTDAQVRRRFVEHDAGRRSETVVAVDAAEPRMVAERIAARLAASGLHSAPIPSAPVRDEGDAIARRYIGRGSELALTVHRQAGGSAVVMHLTEARP